LLKVIQVGYGYWGANIAKKLIQSKKIDLVGLCEINVQRLEKANIDLPNSTNIRDEYQSFLDCDDIKAVIIATQTEPSFQVALDAIEKGKHVFIEKPIATTVARAEQLRDKATEKGVIIHCDHIMVYNPVIRYIKEMIDTGKLGAMLYFDVSRLNLGPIRKDVNAMLDLATHDLAVIDFLSGGKEPIRLTALGKTAFGKQEALTYLTLEYDSFIAHIKSSWVSPLKERRTMIAGSKKMVVFDDLKDEKLKIYNCGIDVQQSNEYGEYEILKRVGDIEIPDIPFEDSLRNSLEFFAHCVQTNTQSLSGPVQSIRIMKIAELAQNEFRN